MEPTTSKFENYAYCIFYDVYATLHNRWIARRDPETQGKLLW